MQYNTLLIENKNPILYITMNRPQSQNSINAELLLELNSVLDLAENDKGLKVIVIRGQGGYFCRGMDFELISNGENMGDTDESDRFTRLYSQTLRRISLIPRVIISLIEGQAMAGGVGLAAASDLVVATPNSEFSLSEALWGLLPAMVSPYLIRRVGFQKAYAMTLTTMPVSAEKAYEMHLVDELSENPEMALRKLCQRLNRIESDTIKDLKCFFRKMWVISDKMELEAADESFRLFSKQQVRDNIVNFVVNKKFPWDK